MLDKSFVESFLRLNNASTSMSDPEVRAVLARAGWTESEIIAALTLLRSGVPVPGAKTGGLSPDTQYSSQQLSSLLGVDINIDPGQMHYPAGIVSQTQRTLIKLFEVVAVLVLAVALAAGLGMGALYYLEIGPFDPTAL